MQGEIIKDTSEMNFVSIHSQVFVSDHSHTVDTKVSGLWGQDMQILLETKQILRSQR